MSRQKDRRIDPQAWKEFSIKINSSGTLLKKALEVYPSDGSKRLFALWKKNQISLLELAKRIGAEDKIRPVREDIIEKLERQ